MINLHQQAQKDLKVFLGAEFGVDIHIVNPKKEKTELRGFVQDVGLKFDPEIENYVQGQLVSVVISLLDMQEIPTSPNKAPFWYVFFEGKGYKIKKVELDHTLKVAILILEESTNVG